MSTWKRWQDWAEVVLGILLIISPFAFSSLAVPSAEWTAFIGGILLVIFGLWNLSSPANRTGEWLAGLVGVLVFIAPWVLGFSSLGAMAWSAWIIGVLNVLLAASVLFVGTARQPTLIGQH
jgi:uncharacterized membrane protein HdeD (DUF308 family)